MASDPDSGWAKFATSGLELVVGIALGAAIGYWIDQHWHTSPKGMAIGASIGFVAGMYLLIKEGLRANKD
jgi:F0F1-type ATP synthase assembly protein I